MASEASPTFHAWDYVVCGGMLAVSILIGIYYGCTGGKQKTTSEFLLADRNMNPIPVAMSLVASFISAITVLGTPAEVYINGSMFWLYGLGFILSGLIVSRLFLPVFYRMRVTSMNEYLEKRFNRVVRVAVSLVFSVAMIVYMGVVIFAPALALSAVSDLNLWVSVVTIGVVCTFYCTIGGMKAVLWTDVFQMCVMMAGFFAIIIEGSIRLGGFQATWKIAEEGQRIDFWNFSPDPTIRHTFWSVVFGGGIAWAGTYGVNQAQVQRYMTMGSLRKAKIALYLALIGMAIVVSCGCASGVVMYSFYASKRCDPFLSGQITQPDQLVPFFVTDLFGGLPGLPGLFTSAVFSAALSTVSSGLNALAAVAAVDLVKPCFPGLEEGRYTLITKGLAVGFGLLSMLVAYIVSLVSRSILQFVLTLGGLVGGPVMGVFSLGLFFPWSNSKGAFTGLLCGLACAVWILIGSLIYPPVVYRPPLVVDGCDFLDTENGTDQGFTSAFASTDTDNFTDDSNFTTLELEAQEPPDRPAIASLYSLSYAWYTFAFWLVTVVVGLLVSFLTGPEKPGDVDPILKQPVADACFCCLPQAIKKFLRCGADKMDYDKKGDDGGKDAPYFTKGDKVKIAPSDAVGYSGGVCTLTGVKYSPGSRDAEEYAYENEVKVDEDTHL